MINIENYLSHKHVLFIFPHPDDEAYSSYGLITRLLTKKVSITLLFLTTGVPIQGNFGPPQSDQYSYSGYTKIRSDEFTKAMELLNTNGKFIIFSHIHSREVANNFSWILKSLKEIVRSQKIELIVCSPYEGAHPDHDLCSFVVNQLIQEYPTVKALEYSGYHLKHGVVEASKFYQSSRTKFRPIFLTPKELASKNHYMRIYNSQLPVFKMFQTSKELFRPKPKYNYLTPPAKELYYESWPSGVNFMDIREIIRRFV